MLDANLIRLPAMGMKARAERIEVENVNIPGHTTRVDAAKYEEMRCAIWKVLPASSPGLSQSEMFSAVRPHLSQRRFPGGATAGWWAKTVQLDLEAKGTIIRERTKPLRWHRKP